VERFVAVMRRLLEPDGCPWDRAQTHRSLKAYLVEEAYELLEAIDGGDDDAIREELGDVLLQIVFHAELARVAGKYDMDDVARGITEKVSRRHPHVFGEGEPATTPAEVEARWDAAKKREKKTRSLLDGIPRSLPTLRQATKLSERAARAGFDWPDAAAVREKLSEEIGELDAAIGARDGEAIRHEAGDVLFSVASLARHLGHDAEEALRECCGRFRKRFTAMEAEAAAEGRPIGDAARGVPRRSIDELEALWRRAKTARRRPRAKGGA
jgi:MazG family protein